MRLRVRCIAGHTSQPRSAGQSYMHGIMADRISQRSPAYCHNHTEMQDQDLHRSLAMSPVATTLNSIGLDVMSIPTHRTASNDTAHSIRGDTTGPSSDPFTTGILIVQTVALGVLIVLACITLFHCREQAKAANAARGKAIDEKLAEMTRELSDLKTRIDDVADTMESQGGESTRKVSLDGSERGYESTRHLSRLSIWERDLLRLVRGI